MKDNVLFSINEADFNNVFVNYYPEVTEEVRERIKDTFIKGQDVEWEADLKEFIAYELEHLIK